MKFPIVIDAAKIPGSLTDFAFLVSEEITGIPYEFWGLSDMQSIRFYDASKSIELDREMVSYDSANKKVEAWVNVPSVSATDDTIIWCYYGDDTSSNDVAVWDVRDAHNVCHLQDIDSNIAEDSSSEGLDGAVNATTTLIDAQIHKGVEWNEGDDGFIDFPNTGGSGLPSKLTSGSGTIKLWLNVYSAPSGVWTFFCLTDLNSNDNYFQLYRDNSFVGIVWRKDTGTLGPNFHALRVENISIGDWHQIVVTSDGVNPKKMYIDGSEVTPLVLGTNNANWLNGLFADYSSTTLHLFYGKFDRSSGPTYVDGAVDDVIIMDHVMTADEVAAEWENQNTPETFASAHPSSPVWFGADF